MGPLIHIATLLIIQFIPKRQLIYFSISHVLFPVPLCSAAMYDRKSLPTMLAVMSGPCTAVLPSSAVKCLPYVFSSNVLYGGK